MPPQKFSVSLTSCKNTLQEIGYINKFENPDSLQKVVRRLPFPLREKLCDIADDFTNSMQIEITFQDLARFVEAKARALAHPVFGNISTDLKASNKVSKVVNNRKGLSFDAWAGAGSYVGDVNSSANASTTAAVATRAPLQTCNVEGGHTCTNHYKGIHLFKEVHYEKALPWRDDAQLNLGRTPLKVVAHKIAYES